MKKTLLALGLIVAVVIACQVSDPDPTPELTNETSAADKAPLSGPIFLVVEQPPTFPGGKEAWKEFLEQNLVVPESKPQGKVFVSFVVDKEGALHDIEITRGIGSGADEVALEVLKNSPEWEVGKQRGKAVNAKMQVAIQFGETEKDLQTTYLKESQDTDAGFDEIFLIVEEQATFPGGTEAWTQFIKNNLIQPNSNVKGKVFASFIIDKEGAVHNVVLIKGIGGGADEAVKELLENSPNWLAGKQKGKVVNSRMQVAISFK